MRAGGHVTNCVIGRSDKIKAAATHVSIWNLTSMFRSDFMDGKFQWDDPAMYIAESPFSRAKNIKAPTLITGAAADMNVPPDQSRQVAVSLSILEVPNKFIVFPNEGHFIIQPSNKLRKVQSEISWFEHYLMGKPLPKDLVP